MKTPLHKTSKIESREQGVNAAAERTSGSGDTELFFKKIHSRAETITPLLQKILDHQPSSRWGISH